MSQMEVDSHLNDDSDASDDELLDASSPEVVEKYKCAGIIANRVLHKVLQSCGPGSPVVELCKLGDIMIEAECAKVYTNLKMRTQKGISFPTCISVNQIAGHCSPYSDDRQLIQMGDMVKVDLGVHIDGFVAVVAHTVLFEKECKGRKADVIAAAWTGAQAALRLLKAHNKNTQLTMAITKAGETFKCEPLESVLSHEMRQYVLDHENTILLKETPERKVAEFDFENNTVFGVDVMMSTGRGKAVDRGDKCTIYKRNVEVEQLLKMKTSRDLLRAVNKNHPTFPFSMREFENERFRFGITECMRSNLIQPYPILAEREGEFVAHFKFTAIITPNGPLQITGLPLDMSAINPQYPIADKDLTAVLNTEFASTPFFFDKIELGTNAIVAEEAKQPPKAKQQQKQSNQNKKGAQQKKKGGKGGKKNQQKGRQQQQKKKPQQNKKQQQQQNKPKSNKSGGSQPKQQRMDID